MTIEAVIDLIEMGAVAPQDIAKCLRSALRDTPQREWQSLTDEEIKSEAKYFCNGWYLENPERLVLLVKTIQAKLREKNT